MDGPGTRRVTAEKTLHITGAGPGYRPLCDLPGFFTGTGPGSEEAGTRPVISASDSCGKPAFLPDHITAPEGQHP